MGKRKSKIDYHLDCQGIKKLSFKEIKAILRAADELIATGGRGMLAKILKGSKDKKLLEYDLDKCPVYGFYHHLTLLDISVILTPCFGDIDPPHRLRFKEHDRLTILPFFS